MDMHVMDVAYLGATESREASLKQNVYNFSVDFHFTDKSDMLKIHKYLMVKNNI